MAGGSKPAAHQQYDDLSVAKDTGWWTTKEVNHARFLEVKGRHANAVAEGGTFWKVPDYHSKRANLDQQPPPQRVPPNNTRHVRHNSKNEFSRSVLHEDRPTGRHLQLAEAGCCDFRFFPSEN